MSDDLKDIDALTWEQIGMTSPLPGPIPKRIINEAIRIAVLPHVVEMTRAQIEAAKGTNYAVTRDEESGKFIPVESPEALALLQNGGARVEVWPRPPSTPAYKELMDRAGGKPTEHVETTLNASGSLAELIAGTWSRPKKEE